MFTILKSDFFLKFAFKNSLPFRITSHVHSRCWGMRALCNGKINTNTSIIYFQAITMFFSSNCIFDSIKIYKSKATRSTSLYKKFDIFSDLFLNKKMIENTYMSTINHCDAINWTKLWEYFTNLTLPSTKVHTKNSKTTRWRRIYLL